MDPQDILAGLRMANSVTENDENNQGNSFSSFKTSADSSVKSSSNLEKLENDDTIVLVSEDDYPDEATFKTAQVCAILNSDLDIKADRNYTPQMVRNIAADFEMILHLDKTEAGASVWTKDKVKELKKILKMKNENNWTNRQTIEYFTRPGYGVLTASADSKSMESLSTLLSEKISESINAALSSIISGQAAIALEDKQKIDELSGQISDLKEQLDSSVKQIESTFEESFEARLQTERDEYAKALSRQSEEIEQTRKAYDGSVALLVNRLDEMEKTNAEKDRQIQELLELTKKQNEQILEQTQKRGFFGFRKKKVEIPADTNSSN